MADQPAPPKTAPKTARSPLTGAEIPLGAHPGNTGGKKGRSGRRSEKLVDFLAQLRKSPDFHAALKAAALDPTSRGFASVVKLLGEYDQEKPAEKKQIVGPVEVRVKIAREGRRVTAS